MMRSLVWFVLLVAFSTSLEGSDWPTYKHDAARKSVSSEVLALPLRQQWEFVSPAQPKRAWEGPRSTPIEGIEMRHRVSFDDALHVVAVGDRLYYGSSVDHQVYCRDAATGELLWNFFTEGPVRLAPSVWQGKTFFGSDDGHVYCVDAEGGKLLWRLRVGPADERLLARGRLISRWPVRTGVLIDDGIAYFGAGIFPHETVYLAAADAKTGQLIWKNDSISTLQAGRNSVSPQGYLLCNDQYLVVPSGRALPAVFKKKTGEFLHQRWYSWRKDAGGTAGGSEALLDGTRIYSSGPHHFLAIEQDEGTVGNAYIPGRQMVIHEGMIYFCDGSNLQAVDRQIYEQATAELQKVKLSRRTLRRAQRRGEYTPAQYQKKAAELDDQEKKWQGRGLAWKLPCEGDGSILLAGKLLIVGGLNQVEMFDIQKQEQVCRLAVQGTARGLVAANGRLFVSTTGGRIYAFANKPKQSVTFAAAPSEPYTDPSQPAQAAIYQSAAEEIIKRTGITRGFCLIVGAEQGQLAYELAQRTSLKIYGIEPNPQKVAAARRALVKAGLYGTRVTIHQASPSAIPYSNYFANLVTSETLLKTGQLPTEVSKITRFAKPLGGTLFLMTPKDARPNSRTTFENIEADLAGADRFETGTIQKGPNWVAFTRGALEGAGSWSHQYGNVGNTGCGNDYLVKGGLRVLWYGDPGPSKMINRHEAAAAPLSTGGRMFIQGQDSVMAYDAYNGVKLWERRNPGARRTGVFNNEDVSNLAAGDDVLFVAAEDRCTAYDASTGKNKSEYRLPQPSDDLNRAWGLVLYHDGILLGTSTIPLELKESLRRRGRLTDNTTDVVFAVDTKTNKRIWTYRGDNPLQETIAIGNNKVFLIDSTLTKEERQEFLQQDKSALAKLTGEEREKAEAKLKEIDVRKAVALDLRSGELLWSQPVDVTDCTHIATGGGNLTLMCQGDHVLICGANANGHYWRQFLSGEFSKRRLLVLSAETGKKVWAKDANYRHRPIIIENEILAEPWKFDLATGKQKTRQHPITGQETPWQFVRPGHHCGMITATPNMLFFRSLSIAYYDLYSDSGTKHFAGQRLGCWVNAIPGNGLLMVPEASAGCVCLFSITSTVVMEPTEESPNWGIFSAQGSQVPVKSLALNLGAPGDRRDRNGTLWLGYPRPGAIDGLDLPLTLKEQFSEGGEFYHLSAASREIKGTETDWLYTSGARGLLRCEIPVQKPASDPREYSVKLHFAELGDAQPGQRVFDIKLQGRIVARGFDPIREAGGTRLRVVKAVRVTAAEKLVLELIPALENPGSGTMPAVCAIEIQREQ